MPQVDIIIRSKNGSGMLETLIESIDKETHTDLYRLIVVDDGSDDPLNMTDLYEVGMIEGRIGLACDLYIRSKKCKGAVTATNLGLAVALNQKDSEYVLIMDNDTEIPDGDTGWLDRMISELDQYGPKTACVAATSDNVSASQQILAVPPTYTADWQSKDKSGRKENPRVPIFVSFCVLIRKSVIRQVGFWDERYNPGNWEDTDYAVQVREAGYDIRVARSVYIHHKCHATFGSDMGKLMAENQEKFAEKWGLGKLWDMGIVGSREIAIVSGKQAGILKETP